MLQLLLRTGALVLALASLACGLSQTEVYEVQGVIESVDPPRLQVRIAHQEIPDFMPAMTMSFDVENATVLDGIRPGDRVRFVLRRGGTLLVVTEIEVTEPGAGRSVGEDAALPAGDPAPEFGLIDQTGARRSLTELRGQAVLLDFVFTRCPGPCPVLTAAHASLQQSLPEELAQRTHFVSISIDPDYDTPERLRVYGEERGADLSRWWFLTGDPERVSDIVRAYHVGTIRQADGGIDHTIITFLIDPQGRIARRYLGLQHPAKEIIDDLHQLLG